jgi:NAD-dependent DNA ligase
MLSLDNAFSDEESRPSIGACARAWARGCPLEYCAEPKLDGLAVSLTYREGKLVRPPRAVTAPRARTSPPICAPFAPCR